MTQTIKFKRLPHGKDLALPRYVTPGAAGMDFVAAVDPEVAVFIAPGAMERIPTGFNVAVPDGYELQIRPRSGLAAKHMIGIMNAPGTIDADYRGEIIVMLVNHGKEPFLVQRGERIAQGVLAPAPQAVIAEVEELDETERGVGGLGSTGR